MKTNIIRNVMNTLRVGKKLGIKAAAERVKRQTDSVYNQTVIEKRNDKVQQARLRRASEELEATKKREGVVTRKLLSIVNEETALRIKIKVSEFLRATKGSQRRAILRHVYDLAMKGNLKTPPVGKSTSINGKDLATIRTIFFELARIDNTKIRLWKKFP